MANENIVYGVNLTADQMKKNLATIQRNQKGVRTWDQILGASSLGYQQQQSALTQQYGDVITEAYKTAMGNEAEIAGLGLSDEQRANQFGLSQADLENTYNKYLSSYTENAQTLADAYSKNVTAIDEALTGEAKNYVDLLNSGYDYLTEIGSAQIKNSEGKTISNYLDNTNSILNKYFYTKEEAEALGNASLAGTLKSKQDVYNNLFDDEGKLTPEGKEFYDAIFNIQDVKNYTSSDDKTSWNTRTFDQWLSDTNPELRTFYATVDPYNFTISGNRAGTLREMLGLESTDYTYHPSEHRIDNTDKINVVSNQISTLENKINTLPDKIAKKEKEIERWEYTGEKSFSQISRAKRELANMKEDLEKYKKEFFELEKKLNLLKTEHNTYK